MKSCPLGLCEPGVTACVKGFECREQDAQRLRSLGVVEGTMVTIIRNTPGMVLDVRGTRVALGHDLAAAVSVTPDRGTKE